MVKRGSIRMVSRWAGWLIVVAILGVLLWLAFREPAEKASNNSLSNNQSSENELTVTNESSTFALLPETNDSVNHARNSAITTADLPRDEGACHSAEGQWQWRAGRCWPVDQATCNQVDGLWLAWGAEKESGCSIRAEDSGRVCRDNAECLGYCLASVKELQAQTEKDDEPAQISGTCSPRLPVVGCVTGLTEGVPGVICP